MKRLTARSPLTSTSPVTGSVVRSSTVIVPGTTLRTTRDVSSVNSAAAGFTSFLTDSGVSGGSVGTIGCGILFTVTAQLPVLPPSVDVAVIVAVPSAIAVTRPVELTSATD